MSSCFSPFAQEKTQRNQTDSLRNSGSSGQNLCASTSSRSRKDSIPSRKASQLKNIAVGRATNSRVFVWNDSTASNWNSFAPSNCSLKSAKNIEYHFSAFDSNESASSPVSLETESSSSTNSSPSFGSGVLDSSVKSLTRVFIFAAFLASSANRFSRAANSSSDSKSSDSGFSASQESSLPSEFRIRTGSGYCS